MYVLQRNTYLYFFNDKFISNQIRDTNKFLLRFTQWSLFLDFRKLIRIYYVEMCWLGVICENRRVFALVCLSFHRVNYIFLCGTLIINRTRADWHILWSDKSSFQGSNLLLEQFEQWIIMKLIGSTTEHSSSLVLQIDFPNLSLRLSRLKLSISSAKVPEITGLV